MILIYIFLYGVVAALWIFGLLVGAFKWTDPEHPWIYILCGVLWPVAGLPAAGFIAAGWYLLREEGTEDGKDN